jgi:hypothetical protein
LRFLPFTAIDTAKTVLQIDSVEGFRSLARRVKAGRIGLLYSGAIANAISAILGHFPWVRETFIALNLASIKLTLQLLVLPKIAVLHIQRSFIEYVG